MSIQDQKECKVKADSLNNSDKDVKSDETKNSDGNESKSECCSPIIAHEIDKALNLLCIEQKSENPIGGNAVTTVFVGGKDKAKANLLFLKERWTREAVLNELIEIQIMSMCLHKDSYERIWNVQKYTSDRIAQLGGKDE